LEWLLTNEGKTLCFYCKKKIILLLLKITIKWYVRCDDANFCLLYLCFENILPIGYAFSCNFFFLTTEPVLILSLFSWTFSVKHYDKIRVYQIVREMVLLLYIVLLVPFCIQQKSDTYSLKLICIEFSWQESSWTLWRGTLILSTVLPFHRMAVCWCLVLMIRQFGCGIAALVWCWVLVLGAFIFMS
jgi:hypothetical protein